MVTYGLTKEYCIKKSFLKGFKQRLIDQYWQEWHNKIETKDRYKDYKTFKENHGEEAYLKTITVTKFRKILTKCRLGILDIQSNKRFSNVSKDLKCPICNQEEENEMHILFKCPCYNYLRQKYISKHWPNNNFTSLKDILSTQEEDKLKDLSMFLFYSMKRKDYMMNI